MCSILSPLPWAHRPPVEVISGGPLPCGRMGMRDYSGRQAMSWADEIARVTGREEYMTASIEITLVVSPGEYDPRSGETTGRVVETLYTGRARVITNRSGVFQQASASMNSRVSEFVRVQIPKNSVGRVLTGAMVRLTSTPDTPAMQGRLLMVQSDFHGTTSATRTLECGYDNDQAAE